ncbi:alpha-ketoacid dehydrogenase subunit beta [Lysinibacillus sp. LZ02]|uniref:alpha-ketoacid dehydrogenase subunit beta n=1 Tax=Lysinibacillus sp. LZ02 TaxID=3420668 RepID=UPI003D35BDFD
MAEMTMVQAINMALAEAMEKDEKVLCLGEDIGKNGGVFRVTDGLFERFGEKRVVDTPIAESAIIGATVGLAARGLKPIAEIQFLGFIYEAMDQMAAQAARLRFRTDGTVTAPLVVRSPYGGGIHAPELHSDSLEGIFLHSPGLKIVMPSSPSDAKGLLAAAINDPDPVLFLEPMKLYRTIKENVQESYYEIPIGQASVINEGTDVSIVTYGPSVITVKQALPILQSKGISAEVIDLRTIAPIDYETIIQSIDKTGRLVIVHEAVKTGGVGAEIAAIVAEYCMYSMHSPIYRVTGYDTPYPVPSIEAEWLPTVERVVHAVVEVMKE